MAWRGPVGEPTAIDLVNTVVGTARGEEDLLDSPAALHEWLRTQHRRLTPQDWDTADLDLTAVRNLRAQVTTLIGQARTGAAADPAGLAALTAAQRSAPAHTELRWTPAGPWEAVPHRTGTPTGILLADLAEAAVDLLAGPDVPLIRDCEGPSCRVLFVATNPRRRWCSPAICGNRARVARYYEAHKDER